jgi:hypothetical protein
MLVEATPTVGTGPAATPAELGLAALAGFTEPPPHAASDTPAAVTPAIIAVRVRRRGAVDERE